MAPICIMLLFAGKAGAQTIIARNNLFNVLESSCSNYLNVTTNASLDTFTMAQVLVVSQPAHGTAFENGKFLSYCPFQGFTGADEFTYSISEGNIISTATVFINVQPFNSLIFPGDADQNGKVENFDVLTIGLAYNLTGPGRFNASALNSLAWSPSNLMNTDPGAADCNGDGIVDSMDAQLVSDNYGQISPEGLRSEVDTSTCGNGIPFYIQAVAGDTVTNGDTLRVSINLGQAGSQIDAYGLAFSLDYDTEFIPHNSINFSTASSWLLPTDSGLFFSHESTTQGRVDMALTNTNQHDAQGGGQVLYGIIPIDDNICGIVHSPGWYNLILKLHTTRLINKYNEVQDICAQQAAIRVYKNVTAVHEISANDIHLYPNPTNGKIFISAEQIELIDITDLAGRKIYSATFNTVAQTTIDIKALGIEAGAYLVQVKTAKGLGVKKIIVQN